MDREVSFGKLIKDYRLVIGLTQAELARRVGCATITLRKIESDSLRPSVQIAERLAMALDVPLDERADFVRLARTASLKTPTPPPVPTPPPLPEEIGEEDLSGRAIRGYQLGERIGEGGFGVVYRATQPLVEREVAIKIILPQYANHPDFIRRFEAEAQLVARLEHPYIVPLYDYWREPGVAYLVMRLLRGGSIHARLREGALPLELALRVLSQICAALHTAHRMGVIHRDLKPSNILLDEDGNAYLVDFGIAKNLGNPNLEDQTRADTILGSPAYISPEQIRSESVRPQADIYSLGLLLYEMLTGVQPFRGPTPIDYIMQHLNQPLPLLSENNPSLPAELEPIIQRATAKDAQDRYPDVLSLMADVGEAVGVLEGGVFGEPVYQLMLGGERGEVGEIENPYKGLHPFSEADADDFFGREMLVQELLGLIAHDGDLSRFLAVVGPSGSGKSSVVKAGLIPALRRGGLPSSENWFVVDFTPGMHPLEELEAALLRVAVNPPESLLGQLREDERGLLRAVRRTLPEDGETQLVLVIDQFEEVFTQVSDEAARAFFLSSLVTAVLDPRSRVRVVITLRADFTDRPLEYVDFGELVRERTAFVLPLTSDELEQAISGPARRAGLVLESGLVNHIIRDVGDQPGTLPLLQYALTELFERREGRRLTLAAYEESGGVMGALGRRAEEIFAGLDQAGQQIARQLFLRLVTLGESSGDGPATPDTRRRVLRKELETLTSSNEDGRGVTGKVIDQFGRYRLLTFDHDPVTRGPTVEVAHEAIMREWERLRFWLSNSRADVRMQRRLSTATAEWLGAERDASFLLRGVRLGQFETWVEETDLALTKDEQDFLTTSLEARRAQEAAEAERQARELTLERRSRNFLRGLVAVFAVATLVALVLFGFARQAQVTAQDEAEARATAQAEAIREREIAEQQARLAVSRELAAAALNNLSVDPERSVLLTLYALAETHTLEAENALHQAIPELHLLRNLSGHNQTVESVAISPDGRRQASASWDGVVKVWDASTGLELLSFPAHGGNIYGMTFSPDGRWLATASDDETAKVWEAATGEQVLVIDAGTQLSAVAFSPDGRRLATGGADGLAIVWDASTGKELLRLSGHEPVGREGSLHPGGVIGVVFSPDASRLITGGADGTARVWDAESGEVSLTIHGHVHEVYIALNPDGSRLMTAGYDGLIKVWEISPGATVSEPVLIINHEQSARAAAYSQDGSKLGVASQDGAARVWDALSGQRLLTLIGHSGLVDDVTFSPDGTYLMTGGEDRIVKLWDLAPGREWLIVAGGGPAYSPDGETIATIQYTADGVAIGLLDSETGEPVLTIPTDHTQGIIYLSYSPDGTRLASASWDGTAKVWDVLSGRELLTLSGHTNRVWKVGFTPDGERLVTVSDDETAGVWDAETGERLLVLGHSGMLQGMAISPDGEYIATASWNDKSVKMWNARTGEELNKLTADNPISDAAFSPDGRYLAASVSDGSVLVWDVSAEGAQEVFTLTGHTSFCPRITFSTDGNYLATASFDGTAKVWDMASGQNWLTLAVGNSPVTDVSFSPDSTRLATGGFDGLVRVFALRLEDLMELAVSRVRRTLTEEECRLFLHIENCPPVPWEANP